MRSSAALHADRRARPRRASHGAPPRPPASAAAKEEPSRRAPARRGMGPRTPRRVRRRAGAPCTGRRVRPRYVPTRGVNNTLTHGLSRFVIPSWLLGCAIVCWPARLGCRATRRRGRRTWLRHPRRVQDAIARVSSINPVSTGAGEAQSRDAGRRWNGMYRRIATRGSSVARMLGVRTHVIRLGERCGAPGARSRSLVR